MPRPSEDNPDKLSLALEPESAAIYSQYMTSQQASGVDVKHLKGNIPTRYMVIDAGGGTIDISVHHEVNGSIEVVNTPSGNAWGGTMVNEQFSQLLQNIVGDIGFKKFKSHGSDDKDRAKNCAALTKIIYREFESQKINFGDNFSGQAVSDDVVAVALDNRFVNFYGNQNIIEGALRFDIEYEDNTLYFSYNKMEDKFMDKTFNAIVSCTKVALEKCRADIETIYLVGGFGGCRYIFDKINEEIKQLYPHKTIQVVVPIDPSLAIAAGAVMWRENPRMFKGRKVDATYGIDASIPEHRHAYKRGYKLKLTRQDTLRKILHYGDMAYTGKVFTSRIMPSRQDMEVMKIAILSSLRDENEDEPDHTPNPDNDLMDIDEYIGELVIDIPNPNNLPIEERAVDVAIDFSGTEIQAKARYSVSGEEVKTVCNFLSSSHITSSDRY